MITEWVYSVWGGFATWIMGMLPPWSAGNGLGSGLSAILGPVAGTANNLGAWIPWDVGATWFTIVIGAYFASLVIRAIKSFIPTISG